MEWIGVYFGLYVLFTIGLYHVLVVKLERWLGIWPWLGFLLLGLGCLYLSIVAKSPTWSMWWGYNAFLNLWSVKEMFEQVERAQNKVG